MEKQLISVENVFWIVSIIEFHCNQHLFKTLLLLCLQKFLLVLCTLIAVVLSQRPPYAGPRQPYPQPHPWFTSSTTTPDPAQNNLGDRAGFTTSSTTTERLPIDAHGDRELFNQIGTWPREKWPYWWVYEGCICKKL